VKKSSFYHTLAFDAPVRGVRVGISHPVWYVKTRMVGLPDGKKIEDIYNFLDTIPACVRRTNRQTDILPRHIRAMHTRRAVKLLKSVHFSQSYSKIKTWTFFRHSVVSIDFAMPLITDTICQDLALSETDNFL